MFVPRRVQGTLAAVHSLHHLTERGLSRMPDKQRTDSLSQEVGFGRGRRGSAFGPRWPIEG